MYTWSFLKSDFAGLQWATLWCLSKAERCHRARPSKGTGHGLLRQTVWIAECRMIRVGIFCCTPYVVFLKSCPGCLFTQEICFDPT